MRDPFYINNKTPSITLEVMMPDCKTFDEFEEKISDEFLADDNRVGHFLGRLMDHYDKKNATVSRDADLYARGYKTLIKPE